MAGLFQENGPLRAKKNGPSEDDYTVFLTDDGSWGDYAHVVYIDQPVTVGFSYGEPLVQKMDDGAEELVNFLVDFYKMYPEFKSN